MKHLSILCAAVLLLAAVFVAGVYSRKWGTPPAKAVLEAGQAFRLTLREAMAVAGAPPWFLHPAHHPGEGVTSGSDLDDGALILLAGFLPEAGERADYIRLIRRDGSTVASWDLGVLEPQREDFIHGILLDPDGTITFNLHERILAQIDRCGASRFQIPGLFHHDLDRAETGGYWAMGLRQLSRLEAEEDYLWPHASAFFRARTEEELATFDATPDLYDDTIVRLDAQGRRLLEFSLHKALHDNGLGHLLALHGIGRERLAHSNSIQELSSGLAAAFPMFAAGDLLLSLRNFHTLAVMDPATRKIKWHQTGPWRRQHDARFQPDGTITLFNNIQRPAPGTREISSSSSPFRSSIMRVDPANGEARVVMGAEISAEADFHTAWRGQHQMLPGGDVLAVVTERGRAVQFGPRGEVLWEYINRHDADRVGQVINAYIYPAGYFEVSDWSCPAR